MEQYHLYLDFQKLLLTAKGQTEIKDFINEHNLFGNPKKTLLTLRLISSIAYSRPKLIPFMARLLSLFDSINLDLDLFEPSTSNEIIQRSLIIYIILILSNHINILEIEDKLTNSQLDIINQMTNNEEKKTNLNDQIIQAIHDDNADLLIELISRNNFDISKKIKSSTFQMHSLINFAEPIQYAAFSGSINCFKYLFLKSKFINYEELIEFAIAGGNYEIIHIIESHYDISIFKKNQKLLDLAILYMNNDLIDYLINEYDININCNSYINCIYASNYDAFQRLKEYDDSNSINSINEYHDYINFLISIPSIIGAQNLYYWDDLIKDSAEKGRKFDVLSFILKHHLIDSKDECGNIIYPLIYTLKYRSDDVKKSFQKYNKIQEEMKLKFEFEKESEDDYDFEYEWECIFEYFFAIEEYISEEHSITKKHKNILMKNKINKKRMAKKTHQKSKKDSSQKTKNKMRNSIQIETREYLQ